MVPPVPPIFPQGFPGWMAPQPQGEGPNQEQPAQDHTDVDTGDTTDNPVGEQAGEEQPNQESKRDSKPETPSSSQTGADAGVYLSAPFPSTPPGGGAHSMNLLPPIPPHFMPFGEDGHASKDTHTSNTQLRSTVDRISFILLYFPCDRCNSCGSQHFKTELVE